MPGSNSSNVRNSSMTIRDVMSITRKNLNLSRVCGEFEAKIPTLTEPIGAIV